MPELSAQPHEAELSAAVQDYAKAIYLAGAEGRRSVSTTMLAARLNVRPASVSGMVKKLQALGLAEHEPYRGVRLTERGTLVALEVVRHHRLLELYLVESLGMTWDEVHAEAEVLEHFLSDQLETLIAEKLGNPTLDPHGDPIPAADLTITREETRTLADLEPGERATLVRVSDSDPEMLRFLAGIGITPGKKLQLVERQPFGGPLYVRVGKEKHALGVTLARAMSVTT
ncbi:MAG TPA: metal-dependent transcriptional regulator [Gaiellaceae bacterium]|jgi:DtxR family Mn-dependent transcriptional regulator